MIIEALRQHLIEGRKESEIRKEFGPEIESESWRSLRRWRRKLLDPLWKWIGPRLGFSGPATSREDGCRRLRRLLAEAGEHGADRRGTHRPRNPDPLVGWPPAPSSDPLTWWPPHPRPVNGTGDVKIQANPKQP